MQNSAKDTESRHWQNRKFSTFHPRQGTPSSDMTLTGGKDHNGFNVPRHVPGHSLSDGFAIRPESSMSNASFVTQTPHHGGVSLIGHPQAYAPQTYAPHMPSQYAAGYNSLSGGYDVQGLGHFNSTAGQQQSSNQLQRMNVNAPSFINHTSENINDVYNSMSRYNAHPTGNQAPTLKSQKAAEIAHMIRRGDTDGPEQYEYGAGGEYCRSSRQKHQIAQQAYAKNHAESMLAKQPVITAVDLIQSRETNTKGNAAAYINVDPVALPSWFGSLATGYRPSVEEVFEVLPVMEACRYAAPSTAGVVRIRNIPYSTPRSEIAAFVGKNAKLVMQPAGSPYYGVHIIMERHSGKTMDAFLEFAKPAEAIFVVSQIQRRIINNRHPKIGDRHVEVEISSQQELMQQLFPRARNVTWDGMTPRVLDEQHEYYKGVKSAGFTGFLQTEEIVMMVKHAETPMRSPFAQRCPVRTYETMISTLHKYPWFAHENVKMTERRQLFDAAHSCLRALIQVLRRGTQIAEQCNPTQATLQELVVAILTCPGFSEVQKSSVAASLVQGGYTNMTSSRGMNLRYGGNTPLSPMWPFQVLVRTPGVQEQVVDYFASLMRLATTGAESLSLADAHAMRASAGRTSRFGKTNIEYGNATTMEEVGRIELQWLEKALSKALPSQRQRAISLGLPQNY